MTRFDRAADDAGIVRRLHQEDLCQALGTRAKDERYSGPSAQRICRLLREASATPRAARANVWKSLDGLVLNTLVGAPDAHARNYAVLLDKDDVTVAPVYDVATGLAYEQPAQRRLASMSFGGTSAFEDMDGLAWRRLAEDVRVDADHLLARARETADALPGAFEEALADVDDEPETAELRERLMPRLREHAQRVVREP